MNFFKIKTSWSNAELIPLKLCIASAYLMLGAYFNDFFSKWYMLLAIVFLITVSASVYMWFTKMKESKKK